MKQFSRSPKQLGHAIQQERLQRNMTQTDLANLVGTSQKTISKMENGNPATRIDTLFAVLAALGLEVTIVDRVRSDAEELAELLS